MVSVKEIPRPSIQHPDDAIIKVTTAGSCLSLQLITVLMCHLLAICGSGNNDFAQFALLINYVDFSKDLHMYQGRTAAEKGLVFGIQIAPVIITIRLLMCGLR